MYNTCVVTGFRVLEYCCSALKHNRMSTYVLPMAVITVGTNELMVQ